MKTKAMRPLTLAQARRCIAHALEKKDARELALIYNEVCCGSHVEVVYGDGRLGVSDDEEAKTFVGKTAPLIRPEQP